LRLYGAGLRVSEKFIDMMKTECNTSIFEVHLDPKNPDLLSRNFSSDIPLDDQTIDYIYAGEIIEHLINPEWMIKESFRILKPGGRMIITTPNISRIGNVFKLLMGRSNLERLSPIGSQDPYDEHRGHFHEYNMKELYDIVHENGFKVVKGEYYLGRVTEMVIRNWRKKITDLIKKPFYIIPHFKDDIFLVAKKI
ncbi:methyltransferase domain-containing protein, partial [Thermodesulfobacteriota bacterium]